MRSNYALQRTVSPAALHAASAQNKFALAARGSSQRAAAERGRYAAVGEVIAWH